LRQVSFFPTGGFIPLIRKDSKEVKDITINADGTKTETRKEIELKNHYLRYTSIDDGTLYEAKIDPYEITRNLLLEIYVPNAEYAYFSHDGKNVIFQSWNKKTREIFTYLANIQKKKMKVEPCPYDFSRPIKLGDDSSYVKHIHEFLNLNPLTRIAEKGVNSPGNEASLATPATITAIKNFQSLYNLDIDGKLGPATRKKMLSICNDLQKKKAEEEFAKEKRKYEFFGYFLPQNIIGIDVSPFENRFFFLQKDKLGVVGRTGNFENDEQKTIFESPFSEWLVDWNGKENIQLTTKPSYLFDGHTFEMSANSGKYHRSMEAKKGLTTLASPDNKKIFISYIDNDGLVDALYDKKSQFKIPMQIQTLPEKCTWTRDSKKLYCFVPKNLKFKEKYPDMWYQGRELFSDKLYEIDGNTGEEKLISDIPDEYQKNLDAIKVNIDDEGDYLYFIDKGTETLWSYRLVDAL